MLASRKQFLDNHGVAENNICFLAQDMSPRTYYRLPDQGVLLMEGPHNTLLQFIHVAKLLQKLGAMTPNVIAFEGEHALIEDWGDHTYTRMLQQGSDMSSLYKEAVDVLINLHKACLNQPHLARELPPYNADAMTGEAMLFPAWCCDPQLPEDAKHEYQNIWQDLWQQCPTTPQVLVLRDYHVDNMMRTPKGQLGLLDFQDALWGPCVYDLTSLLEDARIDIPSDIVTAALAQYRQGMGMSDAVWHDIHLAYNIWGMGRHLKILGVFTRYAKKHGNASKLIHIPRVWGHIDRLLEDDIFQELKRWIRCYFP